MASSFLHLIGCPDVFLSEQVALDIKSVRKGPRPPELVIKNFQSGVEPMSAIKNDVACAYVLHFGFFSIGFRYPAPLQSKLTWPIETRRKPASTFLKNTHCHIRVLFRRSLSLILIG